MKKMIKSFVVFALSLFIGSVVYGQFTRQQAIDLILNDILSGELNKVDVYSKIDSQSESIFLIDNQEKTNTYSESWVFFVDNSPFASWYHDSRLVFISTIDGNYSIDEVDIYPKELSADYEVVSSADRPEPIAMEGTAYVPDPDKVVSNYNYALIIVSMDDYRNWYNTSLVYNVLKDSYNYTEENITVLYNYDGHSYLPDVNDGDLDGDGSNDDIDGAATWSNIQTTLSNLTNSLGHGDQLAVFFTGVPVKSAAPPTMPMMGFRNADQSITPHSAYDVATLFKDLDCGQMIFNFDINSAAQVMEYFEDSEYMPIKCENRYLTGSTDAGEKNHAEMYFSGSNYSEQLFYWASAARGYLPNVWENKPWQTWDAFGQLGSENDGGGAYATYITGHPGDTYLDDNGDGYVQMGEAFNYADDMNCWTSSYWSTPPVPFATTQAPVQENKFPFEDDILTLNGLNGHFTTDVELPARSYIVAYNTQPSPPWNPTHSLTIDGDVTVSFAPYSELYLKGELCSEESSNLIIGDNTSIYGESPNWSQLTVNGSNFSLGDDVTFTSAYFAILSNINANIHNAIFNNCQMFAFEGNELHVEKCEFHLTNLAVQAHASVFVENNSFENGSAFLMNNYHYEETLAYVNANTFEGEGFFYFSIWVENFPDFEISDNNINNAFDGIYANYCGWRPSLSNLIKNNKITKSQDIGMVLYNVRALVTENVISGGSGTGLMFSNINEITLLGNEEAKEVTETQRIMDVNGKEVVSHSAESFPVVFRWNAIVDDDNYPSNDELLYCFTDNGSIDPEYDAKHNFWGNNFNYSEDLFPAESILFDPTFDLNYKAISKTDAEILYKFASSKEKSGDYLGAKDDYTQVVELYPKSRYANSAMKSLFSLEKIIGENYENLKQYYRSNDSIITNPNLLKLGDFLANRCDIELENYPVAIDWFENMIQNPFSQADSVFAIIDLENTYLRMQNSGNKATNYIGTMPEFVPKSEISHIKHTNYLLGLLTPKHDNTPQGLQALHSGQLLQNNPNPFTGNTQIWYKLDKEAHVQINIYNNMGQLIKSYQEGTQTEGSHHIDFSADGLPEGLYFYSIAIDGQMTDSKKMTIIQ